MRCQGKVLDSTYTEGSVCGMFDAITEVSLLYDFYGQLLTEKQRQVVELYHEENLSLSEIAKEFDISRQGVHDTLKKAEQALSEYEEKLGLVKKFADTMAEIKEVDERLLKLITENKENKELTESLSSIKEIIDRLEF